MALNPLLTQTNMPNKNGLLSNQIKPQSVGVQAKSPTANIPPQNNVLSQSQVKQVATSDITNPNSSYYQQNSLYLRPGESKDQYLARTGTANQTTNQPAPSNTSQSSTQTPYSVNNGLYGQLIAGLANRANQPSADYTNALNQAQEYNKQLGESKTEQAKALAANASNPIPLEFQQGRGRVLTDQYLAQQNALAGQFQGATNLLGAANTQQQIGQQGLTSAAGLAAPQQVGYNVQYVNPATGQPYSGGQVGGSLQEAVANVLPKLQSGQMTYNDALNALSGYGQGGINALQQALPQGFNIAQSNTLAGQQGSIGPAYSFAKSALTNLQNIVGQLGLAQGTNIPIINAIGNMFSTQTGVRADKTRQYSGAVQEARNAYAQLLAASRGGTPTEYTAQSNAAIPDNATPNDIQAAINNLESLGQSKLNIYGNPGQSSTNQGTVSAGGFNFKFINGQWIPA